jgi:simple sugar transport system permease protein
MRGWFSFDRSAPARLLFGLALTLAIAGGLVVAAGADPLAALVAMAFGAFGEQYSIAETLIQATPLAIVALGVAPAVRAGVFTIGSEGQLIAGAAAATAAIQIVGAAPAPLLLATGLFAGGIGGALWALVPAVMRAYFRVNEVLSTLLLNYVAGYGLLLLLKTSLGAHAVVAIPHSDALPAAALIPKLIDGTRLHLGLIAAPVAALALAWWLRSPRGLVYDAFATRPALAARLGLAEPRAVMSTMLLAGAAAGLAGWMQVAGVAGTLYPSVGGGLGFSGILVAMLGGLRPLGILAMALLLGALTTGADGLQTGTGVPASLSVVIQGMLLLAAALAFNGRARIAPALPKTSTLDAPS